MVRLLCRLVLRIFGVRRRSVGSAPTGGALVVANHLSWLDIVVLAAEVDCGFVAKQEVAAWPIVGWLAPRCGVVFIDRTRRRDLLRSIPVLEARLREGRAVVLFAEGTTTDGRALRPFKSALVEAAVRAGVPVQPLALRGLAAGDSHALCWIEDESLAANLPRLWRTQSPCFEMHWLEALPAPTDRKEATRSARARIAEQLDGGALQSNAVPFSDARRTLTTAFHGVLRSGVRSALGLFIALGVAIAWLYAQVPRYDFASRASFAGNSWYNPYGQAAPGSMWLRANLHAHAKAWGGVTAGKQPAGDVVRHYRQLGTQVVGVSDYHAAPASRPSATLPVYEHGWNVAKAHRLAIGASSVLWYDVPLWGSVHEEQYAIDRLHDHAELVAIAHPGLRHGHSPASLAQLGNYELLEVLNHFLPPADSAWDAALSAGRAVWLLASDDSHDVNSGGETGTNFTRILARDTSARAVITALRAGSAYGVRSYDHRGTLHLERVAMHGDTLSARIHGRVRTVRVIGQGGKIRSVWHARPASAAHAETADTTIELRAVADRGDGYLRVVAEGNGEWLYTNPVIRWDGRTLPIQLATVNPSRTVLRQTLWRLLFIWLALGWLATLPWPRWRRPRRPISSPA
jgi:1-acyl-sn-glycerol-3-phosphate acyltransferase